MHLVYISREYLPSFRAGGIATYIQTVARQLVNKGHKVTVISASDDTRISGEENDNGVRIIRLSGGDFYIPQVEGFSFIKKFRCFYRYRSYRKKVALALASLENVDIIEIADFGDEEYAIDFSNLNAKVVFRLHTPINQSIKGLKGRILKTLLPAMNFQKRLDHFENITSCSHYIKDKCISRYNISPSQIKVLYNPTPVIDLNPSNFKKDSNIIISFAGTIVPSKGVGELVKACDILEKEISLRLILAGKLSAWGEQLKKEYSTKKWCQFLGNIPHDEVLALFSSSSIVCLPSWEEPFGIVCIEAMMCKKIVIGSLTGGMAEIIENGVDGFLIPPKDIQSLVNMLKIVLNLKENERKQIVENAYSNVVDKFSSEVIINKMIEYYEFKK